MGSDTRSAPPGGERARWRRVTGWLAVAFYAVAAALLAQFGITSAFRFGWYHESFWTNLVGTIVPYLVPTFLVMLLGLVSLRWSRVALAVHLVLAAAVLVIEGQDGQLLAGLALSALIVLLGVLFFTDHAAPRRRHAALLIGLPLLTLAASGLGPAIRVATRMTDDIETGARRVVGNGLTLVWAPAGPGWPSRGVDWSESLGRCRLLAKDGRTVRLEPVDVWRLPTVDQVVRSLARHGVNSGGTWDETGGEAHYEVLPDKESPLWDGRTQVVVWWTSTEADEQRAYTVAFGGEVESRGKNQGNTTLGFRCVRNPGPKRSLAMMTRARADDDECESCPLATETADGPVDDGTHE